MGQQEGLIGFHANVAHDPDHVSGKVMSPPVNVGANHRKKHIHFCLWLKELSGSKLGVIGYGISTTNFKFYPKAT
jgi:hypothetical protein